MSTAQPPDSAQPPVTHRVPSYDADVPDSRFRETVRELPPKVKARMGAHLVQELEDLRRRHLQRLVDEFRATTDLAAVLRGTGEGTLVAAVTGVDGVEVWAGADLLDLDAIGKRWWYTWRSGERDRTPILPCTEPADTASTVLAVAGTKGDGSTAAKAMPEAMDHLGQLADMANQSGLSAQVRRTPSPYLRATDPRDLSLSAEVECLPSAVHGHALFFYPRWERDGDPIGSARDIRGAHQWLSRVLGREAAYMAREVSVLLRLLGHRRGQRVATDAAVVQPMLLEEFAASLRPQLVRFQATVIVQAAPDGPRLVTITAPAPRAAEWAIGCFNHSGGWRLAWIPGCEDIGPAIGDEAMDAATETVVSRLERDLTEGGATW